MTDVNDYLKEFPYFLGYISKTEGLLIVSTNKVASTYLTKILIEKRYFKCVWINDATHNDVIDPITEKYFLYRDPLERFIGWYNLWIYEPYLGESELEGGYKSKYKKLYNISYSRIKYIKN